MHVHSRGWWDERQWCGLLHRGWFALLGRCASKRPTAGSERLSSLQTQLAQRGKGEHRGPRRLSRLPSQGTELKG